MGLEGPDFQVAHQSNYKRRLIKIIQCGPIGGRWQFWQSGLWRCVAPLNAKTEKLCMCAVSVCVCDPAKLVFLEQPFPRKKWSNHKAGKCTSSHSCTQSHLHNQTISEYLFWDAFRLSLSAKNITSFLDNTYYFYRGE